MNNALRLQVVPCLGGLYKLFEIVVIELTLFPTRCPLSATATKAKYSRSSAPGGKTPVKIELNSID